MYILMKILLQIFKKILVKIVERVFWFSYFVIIVVRFGFLLFVLY